ncbi:hypothetical protein [Ciceribacter sp. L1K22]|uniref:hypothetical protein n=1 Tax=Ciceribacter sp. L1K22 TaxID=2820275 RepID=UPI001ABE5617|nr:hypothetical protein [Ciceribacter sp. L1K22]MBO3760391.1 hypothetical protein [Ciceribacter sp. L1K22]
MTEQLRRVQSVVADHMDDIAAYFKSGAKITVLVRTPDNPEADFCMTSDDLTEVVAMVERRRSAGAN